MKPKVKALPVSRSVRAGLMFPVGRTNKILKDGHYAKRIGSDTPVYLTAVLEYLCSEILELAAKAADENGKTRIRPRHIMMAVKNDPEIDELLKGVIISQSGVIPHIQPELLPWEKKKHVHQSQEF